MAAWALKVVSFVLGQDSQVFRLSFASETLSSHGFTNFLIT